MPKKHQSTFAKPGSSYVHPSLSVDKNTSATPAASTITVNERLQSLRIAQVSSDSANKKRELAETSNQKSVPPSIGGILGQRETAGPAPKPGSRPRIRLRTPGPAPPRSWLYGGSQHGQSDGYRAKPRKARSFGAAREHVRSRPDQPGDFPRAIGERCISHRSLVHISLRTIAENWHEFEEDLIEYVADLPVHMRTSLLGYLDKYGPSESVAPASLRVIINGTDRLECVDLSGLIGYACLLKEVSPALVQGKKRHSQQIVEDSVAESWESEDSDPTMEALSLHIIRPSTSSLLTKLSLARPGPLATWTDLLSLTSNLPTLTHLSLAYWPFPTKTPNMKDASYVSKAGSEVAAGGSGRYSALDNDYIEAATILRQLSKTTYCLRWLDLAGCDEWIVALTKDKRTILTPNEQDNAWTTSTARSGPDWSDAWRQMTYLNLSPHKPDPTALLLIRALLHRRQNPSTMTVGYKSLLPRGHAAPARPDSVDAIPTMVDGLIAWLVQNPGEQDSEPWTCGTCGRYLGNLEGLAQCQACNYQWTHAAQMFLMWVEAERRRQKVGRTCAQLRGPSAMGPLVVDYQWKRS